MRTKHLWIASVLCLFLSGAVAWAMASASTQRGPVEKKPATCGPVNPVIEYANRVRIEDPQRHGGLALFPIAAPGLKAPPVTLTLTQAARKGLFEVSELKESDVNRAQVRNRAKEPVFVMSGEMLRGGKQDRIAGDDLIVPAKTTLTIPVFCVEHGRWAGRESGFSVGRSLAGGRMRKAARAQDQEAVWSSVAEQQRALRAPSATGALRSVHDSDAVRERMKPYLRALSDLPDEHRKAVGIVAVFGDQIVGADLFTSRKLFEELWPDLLEAYVIDVLEREEIRPLRHRHDEKGATLDEKAVLRWLNGLRSARMSPKDTPGDGDLLEVSGQELDGSALLYDCGVVHMGLFPAEAVIARPDYNPLEFRRERAR